MSSGPEQVIMVGNATAAALHGEWVPFTRPDGTPGRGIAVGVVCVGDHLRSAGAWYVARVPTELSPGWAP